MLTVIVFTDANTFDFVARGGHLAGSAQVGSSGDVEVLSLGRVGQPGTAFIPMNQHAVDGIEHAVQHSYDLLV